MANTNSLDLESSSSQYAESTAFANTITTDLTIEFWVKPESFTAAGTPVSKWKVAANARAYQVQIDTNGDIVVSISNNGGAGITVTFTSTDLATGTWQHIAVVFTNATHTVEVFKDGVSVGTNSTFGTGIDNGTQELAIGTIANAHGSYYDGLIDDVRIWNIVRTSTDIANNKNKELTGSETGLVHYYKLNNDYTDSAAGAKNLTAVGSPVFSTDVPFVGGTIPNRGYFKYQAVKRASFY